MTRQSICAPSQLDLIIDGLHRHRGDRSDADRRSDDFD
jgi:hypothetical protein